MIYLVSGSRIAGHRVVRTLGLVQGSTVRAKHLGKDLVAGFKNLLGGEIEEYTKMMAQAREQALDRMVAEAVAMGANAVTDIRFTSCEIASGAAEIMVYGTAVVVEEEKDAGD